MLDPQRRGLGHDNWPLQRIRADGAEVVLMGYYTIPPGSEFEPVRAPPRWWWMLSGDR